MTAYAAGDAAAFEQLYARHRAGLYRFVRRLLGVAHAAQTDEVFQDTWLRVVTARATWAPQGASLVLLFLGIAFVYELMTRPW